MKILNLYPKKELLQQFADIEGQCEVYKRDSKGPLTGFYICLNKNTMFSVNVAYTDVIFKFECFGLDFHEAGDFLPDKNYAKVCDISFKKIRAYSRFGWERPFLPEEENPYNSPTIIEEGRKRDVPASAIAACSSLVGVVFFSELERPVLLIAHDISSTVEMIISMDEQNIISYISQHDEFSLKS